MDMQGTPIGSTKQGMKNTSDPEAKFASTNESTGAVASDSLAAESSTFQRSNPGQPLAVEGSKSTFANTDTSGATTLPPANSASARESDEDQDVRYPEGTGGVPKFAGGHNADGYSGGSTQAQQEIRREQGGNARQYDTGTTSIEFGNASSGPGNTSTGYSSAGPGSQNTSSVSDKSRSTGDNSTYSGVMSTSGDDPPNSSSADTAPSYVTNQSTANAGKPKGKNLTEGGFDDDDGNNNASYTTDIGSENDPGRAAQQNFQKLNAATAGSNARPQEQGVFGEGTYDALETENEA